MKADIKKAGDLFTVGDQEKNMSVVNFFLDRTIKMAGWKEERMIEKAFIVFDSMFKDKIVRTSNGELVPFEDLRNEFSELMSK